MSELTLETIPGLLRNDLMAACKDAGLSPNTTTGNWLPYKNDELREILAAHVTGTLWTVPPPASQDDNAPPEPATDRQLACLARYYRDEVKGPHGRNYVTLLSDFNRHDPGNASDPKRADWFPGDPITKAEASRIIAHLKSKYPDAKAPKTEPKTAPTEPEPKTEDTAPPTPTATTTTAPTPEATAQLVSALTALGIGGQDPRVDTIAQAVETLSGEVSALADLVTEDRRPVVTIKLPERPDPITLPDTHHPVLPRVIALIRAGRHVWLSGPAGTGKSTIAHQAATALDRPFHAISVGPATPTSKLWGFIDAGGTYHASELYKAWIDGGVFLVDEIDAGHPGINTELNQALANGTAAFPVGMVAKADAFACVATANTVGRGADQQYLGRNAQDAALLDRFYQIHVDYDANLERALVEANAQAYGLPIADATRWMQDVWDWRRKAAEARLPVVIGTRALVNGVVAMACGETRAQAIEGTFGASLKAPERERLGIH